jgi:hypothetical protein
VKTVGWPGFGESGELASGRVCLSRDSPAASPSQAMNGLLLNHSLGIITYRDLRRALCSRLLHAIQPSNVAFEGPVPAQNDSSSSAAAGTAEKLRSPHIDGVNAITIDKFEGR